jgi:purine-binding chemotaxis protein CheW
MTDHYILFMVAGTAYALPSLYVAHVEMVEDVTRVPNAPHYVDGVVFSRGAVVPALSLRARFGFERQPYDTRTRLLVVQAEERTVGFIVDAAREFVRIPPDSIKPPSDALSGLSGRYLRGIATLNDRMILILELERVLDADDRVVAAGPPVDTRQSQEIR